MQAIKVSDLDRKLDELQRALGLKTRKQLADLLYIDPGNLSHWTNKDYKNGVPANHIESMAKLVGATGKILVELTGKEFAEWIRRNGATTEIWDRVLNRAQPGYIKIVRVDPPQSARRIFPVRRVAFEDEKHSLPPEAEEVLRIDDLIYLNLAVPAAYFRGFDSLHALVLLTDDKGTQFVTPPSRPLPLNTTRPMVLLPQDAPKKRLKLRSPPGSHQFTAVFLDKPLNKHNEALVNEFQGLYEEDKVLANAQLNILGGQLLSLEPPYMWMVSTKRFFVTPH